MDLKEKLISKTVLAFLCFIFAILAVIGAATHFLLAAVFSMFFMAAFGSFIGMDKIKKWFNSFNDLDLW